MRGPPTDFVHVSGVPTAPYGAPLRRGLKGCGRRNAMRGQFDFYRSTVCGGGAVQDRRRSLGEKLASKIGEPGRVLALTAAVSAVALGTLLLSPLILSLLGRLILIDGQSKSNVRQSFTGIGTIISAIALLAVAVTMRIQATQTALTREQGAQAIQFELLKLAIDDRAFRETYGSDYRDEDDELTRQRMYQTLRLRYLRVQIPQRLNV